MWADVDAIYQVLKQAGEIRGNSTNSPPTPPTADHPPAPSSARASSHPCSSSTSGKTQAPAPLDLEAEASPSPLPFKRNARQFFYLLLLFLPRSSPLLPPFLGFCERVECSSAVHPTVTREIADKWLELSKPAINRRSLGVEFTNDVFASVCKRGRA